MYCISARQHNAIARYMPSPVRLSVCLSIRHTSGSVKDGWSQDHYAIFSQ